MEVLEQRFQQGIQSEGFQAYGCKKRFEAKGPSNTISNHSKVLKRPSQGFNSCFQIQNCWGFHMFFCFLQKVVRRCLIAQRVCYLGCWSRFWGSSSEEGNGAWKITSYTLTLTKNVRGRSALWGDVDRMPVLQKNIQSSFLAKTFDGSFRPLRNHGGEQLVVQTYQPQLHCDALHSPTESLDRRLWVTCWLVSWLGFWGGFVLENHPEGVGFVLHTHVFCGLRWASGPGLAKLTLPQDRRMDENPKTNLSPRHFLVYPTLATKDALNYEPKNSSFHPYLFAAHLEEDGHLAAGFPSQVWFCLGSWNPTPLSFFGPLAKPKEHKAVMCL